MIRILGVLFLFFAGLSLQAQSIKPVTKNNHIKKEVNKKYFVMTTKDFGIYTVKVIGPHGDVQSTPVKKKKYLAGQKVEFELDTKNWRKGTYHIIAENAEGGMLKKRDLIIK